MQEWLRLDPEKLNTPKHITIEGADVVVRLSPYDVPIAVRGHVDSSSKNRIVEFRYLDDEPASRRRTLSSGVIVHLGRNSDRVCRIEFPLSTFGPTQPVSVLCELPRLSGDFNTLSEEFKNHRAAAIAKGNYRIAGEVIAEQGERLFTS